ncbi:MAG TPA: hypothetical protein GXZ82_00120 [Firmicutes bacterium]|jgi:hypothetical protein|nr:hypothetical protein [Bacillota bacterium]
MRRNPMFTALITLFCLLICIAPISGAEPVQEDPLLEFRQLVAKGFPNGHADRIIEAGRNRTAGSFLAWSSSYLWDAYLSAYEVSGEYQWLDQLIKDFDAAFSVRDDVMNYADYAGRVQPVWGTFGYTGDEYTAWAVHNGWAAYPMLRFAKLVLNEPDLPPIYHEKAQEYVEKLRGTLDAYDVDWREGPRAGQGYYIFPADMPFASRGNKMPLNQHNAMGLALFLMADLTGEQKYFDKAAAMAEYFRSVLKQLPNGSIVWSYWGNTNEATATPPQKLNAAQGLAFAGEDISHAVINARFAYEAYLHGVAFTLQDMQGIARAVVDNITQQDDQGGVAVYWQMNGRGNLLTDGSLIHVSRGWTFLTQFDPRVYLAARQTYAAAPENTTAVLRVLGAAQLARWAMDEEQIASVLRQGFESGDPWAPKAIIPHPVPKADTVITGPTQVDLPIIAMTDIENVAVYLNQELIYTGKTAPRDLVINTGELADAVHTMWVDVTMQGDATRQIIPFTVSNLTIISPATKTRVQGTFELQLNYSLPDSAVHAVEVLVGDTVVYTGETVPAVLQIDTKPFADKTHTVSVRVTTKQGAIAEKSVDLYFNNLWSLIDGLDAPIESSWFGVIDTSRTIDNSDGWQYDTSAPENFFGDKSRRTRMQNTTEYLTWETPALRSALFTLYVKDPAYVGQTQLYTSVDGVNWTPLVYVVTDQTKGNGGWYRVLLSAQVPANRSVEYLKLIFNAGVAPVTALQLGNADLVGELDPASD